MRRKAYLLVLNGMADWETAHALCEIRESGTYEVVTAGFSDATVTTMAGLRVIPDVMLDAVKPAEAAIFILPGGDRWEEEPADEMLTHLLRRLHAAGVPVAAIGGAILEVARARLTRGVRHTSNGPRYLPTMLAGYSDEAFYVDLPAVSDQGVITAGGLGSVEFAREILKELGLYSAGALDAWYAMFKHGIYSPVPALEVADRNALAHPA